MQLKALGEITRLTMGHNNRGRNPGWHLDHATVTHEASGKLNLHTQGLAAVFLIDMIIPTSGHLCCYPQASL